MSSPVEIKIALHYWTGPTEYAADDENHRTSGVVRELLDGFVLDGLLEKLETPNKHGGTYKATDALGVWVEALCKVKRPVQIWTVPA